MQSKEELQMSVLGSEKLGWGEQWEPPPRTWGEGAQSRSAGGEGQLDHPKVPGISTFQASGPKPRPG